jgi:hypothetical protein
MNIYQIVSPFTATIYGDSFKEAVKRYIKLNRNININHMIVSDQNSHMRANIRYFNQDGRNKVGINMYPVDPLVGMAPVAVVRNKSEEKYLPQNVVQPIAVPVAMPVGMPMVSTTLTSPNSAVPITQQSLSPIFIPQIKNIVADVVAKATGNTTPNTNTDINVSDILVTPTFPFVARSSVIPIPSGL